VKARRRLRRYHIWLGWIVGLPLLMWTVTGLFMAARPIAQVRGEALLSAPAPLPTGTVAVLPPVGPRPVAALTLQRRGGGVLWIVRYADGGARLADGATGRLLPAPSAADAAAIVRERYSGTAAVAAVERTLAESPPLDLRRPVAAWRVTMNDGTRFYLDSATGDVLATRTRLWRAYDFMWGLHILDPAVRANAHNPLLLGLAAASLLAVALALILLPMTVRRRRSR
jgi:uncharacterized iron-regulated membrane protein